MNMVWFDAYIKIFDGTIYQKAHGYNINGQNRDLFNLEY